MPKVHIKSADGRTSSFEVIGNDHDVKLYNKALSNKMEKGMLFGTKNGVLIIGAEIVKNSIIEVVS